MRANPDIVAGNPSCRKAASGAHAAAVRQASENANGTRNRVRVNAELTPKKQSILFELGLNAFARGQNDEAVGYFKEAYEVAPEYQEAKMYYISALIRGGKDAEADAMVQTLVEADIANDSRIASAYASRGRYDRIVYIWQRVAEDFSMF